VFYNKSVKEMLITVNELNFLFVNECPLNPESKKNFSLTIKYKDKQTVIDFDQLENENNNGANDANDANDEAKKSQERKTLIVIKNKMKRMKNI
jgi:hypothetical protein